MIPVVDDYVQEVLSGFLQPSIAKIVVLCRLQRSSLDSSPSAKCWRKNKAVVPDQKMVENEIKLLDWKADR